MILYSQLIDYSIRLQSSLDPSRSVAGAYRVLVLGRNSYQSLHRVARPNGG